MCLDPSVVRQGSEARDDGIREARRTPFVAFRDISPVLRGDRPEGESENMESPRIEKG